MSSVRRQLANRRWRALTWFVVFYVVGFVLGWLHADGLRTATLFLGGAGLGMSVYVMGVAGTREQEASRPRLNLYTHIQDVAVAHQALIVAGTALVVQHFGEPISWRAPLVFAASALTLKALGHMLAYQRSRLVSKEVAP